jgi:hypothetical protein
MTRAHRSGRRVTTADIPIVLAMVERGDRRHDIAAWLGLNQGRIAEVEDGQHGSARPAPQSSLPPSGSPGPKALDLRRSAEEVYQLLNGSDATAAKKKLSEALVRFDRNQ